MILHLVSRADWDAQHAHAAYTAPSLATEGFIHCTGDLPTLLTVANAFYTAVPGEVLILEIDEKKLSAPVKWEAPAHIPPQKHAPVAADDMLPPETRTEASGPAPASAAAPLPTAPSFPHVYGPINRAAITGIRRLTRDASGVFTGSEDLPPSSSPVDTLGAAAAPDKDTAAATDDPLNPLRLKKPSELADELLDATDNFTEALKRMRDRVEGRIERLDDEISQGL